jgi:hypothetical protein
MENILACPSEPETAPHTKENASIYKWNKRLYPHSQTEHMRSERGEG